LDDNIDVSARTIAKYVVEGTTTFKIFRTVLKSPSWILSVLDSFRRQYPQLVDKIVTVDPLSLSYLARHHYGGNNNDRVTYIDDNIPIVVNRTAIGLYFNANFTIRNNGWNTLRDFMIQLHWKVGDSDIYDYYKFSSQIVESGDTTTFATKIVLPSIGRYKLSYGIFGFDKIGNQPWAKDVILI